jgi:hypothetical protein
MPQGGRGTCPFLVRTPEPALFFPGIYFVVTATHQPFRARGKTSLPRLGQFCYNAAMLLESTLIS